MEIKYVLWDFVTSDGSTYLYTNKIKSIGEDLTNRVYWKRIATGLSEGEINAVLVATQEANTARDEANASANDANQALATIDSTLTEINEVISDSLNDLNNRTEDIESTLTEFEEVVVSALNDLNNRIIKLSKK